MAELCDESGVIYVLDRGYVDYNSLYAIDLRGSTFVTRMKSNGAYKRIRNNPHEKNRAIVSDVLIQLTGTKTKMYYPKPIRKIKYYDAAYHHPYEFITNDFEMAAQDIADIYKRRWQVELFFKWIKQNLKIKSFWGTSMNAVYSQIWVALIISVLLWICKTLNGITASAHQLVQMMKTTLLAKCSIPDLCPGKPPPLKIPSPQLLLEGFYD
jgi:IS4 transposase